MVCEPQFANLSLTVTSSELKLADATADHPQLTSYISCYIRKDGVVVKLGLRSISPLQGRHFRTPASSSEFNPIFIFIILSAGGRWTQVRPGKRACDV